MVRQWYKFYSSMEDGDYNVMNEEVEASKSFELISSVKSIEAKPKVRKGRPMGRFRRKSPGWNRSEVMKKYKARER